MTPGTKLKIGDKVLVAKTEFGIFSGTGEVSGVRGDWVTVFPIQSNHSDWKGEREFKADRLTLLPPVSETAPEETPSSFHFFEVLLDAAEEAHPSSKSFYNELITCGLLHAQKQRDYGKPSDPFANVRSTEEWGINGWVGAMVRLNDKVKRLQSLARTGGLANESAIDSFRDIAVYSLIALVLYQQESAKDTA